MENQSNMAVGGNMAVMVVFCSSQLNSFSMPKEGLLAEVWQQRTGFFMLVIFYLQYDLKELIISTF